MAKNIAMPDGSVVEFPDTMSDDDIGAAIKKNSAPPSPAQTVNSAVASVPRPQVNMQPAPEDEGFTKSLLNAASPAGAEGGVSDIYKGPAYAVQHPIDSLKLVAGAYGDASNNELQQAKDAYAKKDYGRAALHGVGYAIPFVGPAAAKSGEQANAGNIPGALGTIAGTVGPALVQGGIEGAIKPNAMPNVPSATESLALRRALRPTDKDLRFDQHVQNAWPRIQDQVSAKGVPADLPQFDDMLKNAKKEVWAESSDLLQQAANKRPNVKGLLPAATGEIDTGVQQVKSARPDGGLFDAESRAADRYGHPPFQSDPFTPQAADQPPQFLSGSEHPELSGKLTNPATLITRDQTALTATRNRLAAVVGDEQHFSKLSPGEQTAYTSQLDRLNKLLEPGPDVPHGPTISGDAIADAIEKSIRPRNKFLNSDAATSLKARADAYRGRAIPLTDAEDFLQDANREASGWFNQATRDPHGPQFGASAAAEGQAIRSQLYKQIDNLSESDPGTAARLKREYGALDALHDYTAKRIPVAARQAPLNLAQQFSLQGAGPALGAADFLLHHNTPEAIALAAAPYAISKAVRHLNSPEYLMQRAIKPSVEVPAPLRAAIQTGGRGVAGGSLVAPKKKADK